VIAAVVFDMDGVIVDTEQMWDEVREKLVADWGGRYSPAAQRAMMGMSSGEWSRYLHDEVGLPQTPEEINDEVVRRMLERYRSGVPLIDGAVDAVRGLAKVLPLAMASSSNRPLIDAVLATAGITDCFVAIVSSEEVPRGKPSPDVYLEAARRLGVSAAECVAIEDSDNGIRAAHAAGMCVIAYPNRHYPPEPAALALADVLLASLDELTPERKNGIIGLRGLTHMPSPQAEHNRPPYIR
jgi:HAD superfamily hydrolase (TIGR01509 family)